MDSDHPLEVVLKREGEGNDGEVEKKEAGEFGMRKEAMHSEKA